jgi:hypothetical protein
MKERRIIYKKDFGELDRIAVKERYYWLEVACGLYPKILADARDIFQKHRALFPTREVLDRRELEARAEQEHFDIHNKLPKREVTQGKTRHKSYLTLADCSWWFISNPRHAAFLGSFPDALTAWANTYHLCDWEESTPHWWWVLDIVLENMWLWNFHDLPTRKQVFYRQGIQAAITDEWKDEGQPPPIQFTFTFRRWEMYTEKREDYENALNGAFEHHKAEYLNKQQKRLDNRSEFLMIHDDTRPQHFERHVKRQIKGESAKDQAGLTNNARHEKPDDYKFPSLDAIENSLETVSKHTKLKPRKLKKVRKKGV